MPYGDPRRASALPNSRKLPTARLGPGSARAPRATSRHPHAASLLFSPMGPTCLPTRRLAQLHAHVLIYTARQTGRSAAFLTAARPFVP
jgi:hypothetical protein